MKNIKTLLLVIVVFSSQFSIAQEHDLIRAKRYFDRTFYSEALPFYENLAQENRSTEVVKKLADCYFYTNDLKNAEKWYSLLYVHNENLDPDFYFKYIQTLKALGKYNEANTVSRIAIAKEGDPMAIAKYERDLKTLENVTAIGKRFDIKNLIINTKKSEFGAVVYGENLVFAGEKSKVALFGKTYKWTNESYLDLKSVLLKKLKPSDSIAPTPAFENINSGMHESNAIFTKDGKTMYFTRNYSKNGSRAKDKNKVSNLQIYKAELKDGKWQNIKSLSFNNPNYSTEHPALSPDEKTLYFASDMPGGLGSFDIYSATINDGVYGFPKNLGDKINTSKKEQFPFVSAENKLYFSSNGLLGYGSLDIFMSEIKNDEFTTPLNVGLPVNSGSDDFAFTINNGEGYFSSNRTGGKGSDDIYWFKETKPLIVEDCKQLIAGIISDIDTRLPLDSVNVVLQNENKIELQRVVTASDGKFNFTVECEKGYSVFATRPHYTSNKKYLTLNKERNKINDASMTLKSEEAIKRAEQLAFEKKRKEEELALENAKKEAEIEKKNAEIEAKNQKIAAAIELKNKAIQDKKDKIAALEKKKQEKQESNKKPKSENEDKLANDISKKPKIDDLVAKEKDVVKDKDRLLIKTDQFYFDYNLWYIRRESKVVLNKVIELMKKHPEMVVEIGCHTDNRGSAKYNENLSSKRASSARDYFISQGIPENRVIAKGYGESMPLIKCDPPESCSEEDQELNRRSEFVIKNL